MGLWVCLVLSDLGSSGVFGVFLKVWTDVCLLGWTEYIVVPAKGYQKIVYVSCFLPMGIMY